MSTAVRTRSLAMAGAVAALVGAVAAMPAAAAPLDHGTFRDTSSEVVEDCGLTLGVDREVNGSFLVNPHGPDGLAYFVQTAHGAVSYTNLATGKSYSTVFNLVDKDQVVTDNGDGTLTILVLATGGQRWYGPDGKLLFRDSGQIRFEFLVDHAGTPTDPSDDDFLADLGLVKGSTGRNDTEGRDFCDDLLEFTA